METQVADTQPAVEQPAPEAKPKKAKAPRNDFITYRSTEKESSLWDLLIAGEIIRGAWDAAHERVIWTVPAGIAERLDEHIQVKQGRISRAGE